MPGWCFTGSTGGVGVAPSPISERVAARKYAPTPIVATPTAPYTPCARALGPPALTGARTPINEPAARPPHMLFRKSSLSRIDATKHLAAPNVPMTRPTLVADVATRVPIAVTAPVLDCCEDVRRISRVVAKIIVCVRGVVCQCKHFVHITAPNPKNVVLSVAHSIFSRTTTSTLTHDAQASRAEFGAHHAFCANQQGPPSLQCLPQTQTHCSRISSAKPHPSPRVPTALPHLLPQLLTLRSDSSNDTAIPSRSAPMPAPYVAPVAASPRQFIEQATVLRAS